MNKLMEELKGARRIAVAGHVRPDGDCIGSCMAAAGYIKKAAPQVKVDVYLERIAPIFRFLKGAEDIRTEAAKEEPYDVFLSLDASSLDRLGKFEVYFEQAKKTVCVDHHVSNKGFAMVNHVEGAKSSTCEVLYELFDEELLDASIAEALYLGIAHDTGVFQYSNTSPRTMEIAGKLISFGIPFTKLVEDTFYKKTYVQNQIMGRALLESVLLLDGRVIFSAVRKTDMDFYGVTPGDLDGIVSQLRVTEGVEVALFLYETALQEWKVSLRSCNKVDVSVIAAYFGGGGHVRAAGCTMAGNIYDVINNLTPHIERQLAKEEPQEEQAF